jgi:predicted transcriptional regulator
MGRNSIISIGQKEFEVLNLISLKLSIKEVRISTRSTYQQIESIKKKLVNSGWIDQVKRGRYEITNNGKYFLEVIKRYEQKRKK